MQVRLLTLPLGLADLKHTSFDLSVSEYFSFSAASAGGCGDSLQNAASPQFQFLAADHANSLLSCMKMLRDSRVLCDITLCVGEDEFPAHRVVLASCSPYFNAMFTNQHVESRQNRITLEAVEASMLEILLNFMYSSTVEIREDNVQGLLSLASLLQLVPVIEACCEFLRVRLDTENCLGIASFAERYGCANLHEVSWQFALTNFVEVAESEEFLTVHPQDLINILKSEDLNVRSEEDVLDFVLRWYQHDQLTRVDTIASVLQYVKLPLIPWQLLQEKILSNDQLAAIPECQALLTMARHFQVNPEYHQQDEEEFSRYIPRKSVGQGMFVYVVGGETSPGRSTVNTVEQFNPRKNIWKDLAPMETTRRGVGVDILNGFLYAVGGSDGLHALRVVECYDPHVDAWKQVADMNQERSSVCVAVMNGYLYAIGGYDGIVSCLQSVECYDPTTNSWSEVASMNSQRSMMAVAILSNKKQFIVVGGYDGSSDLASCEMYDAETDSWSMIEEMHMRRCMAGVGVIDGLLYAVGGCDCSQSLRSMEVYDPEKNKWSVLAEMTKARSGLGVAVVGRRLYAVGGYSGTGPDYCSSVECYDPDRNSWIFVASMQVGRRRFGCCS